MASAVLRFRAILAFAIFCAVLSTLARAVEEGATTADHMNAEEPTQSSSDETASEGNPSSEPIPDDTTLLKMKVRELKAILAKKGREAECVACTSKREYVDRIRDTWDWPDVPEEEGEDDEDTPSLEELAAMFNKGRDSEDIAKLKKNLEEAGIDPSNLFSTGDNFDADAFAKKFASWEKKHGASANSDVPPPADDAKAEL